MAPSFHGLEPPDYPSLFKLGVRWDHETALYLMGARYYDPVLGRFISPDPARIDDDESSYLYGRNNPVTNADPLGLYSCPSIQCPMAASASSIPEGKFLLPFAAGESHNLTCGMWCNRHREEENAYTSYAADLHATDWADNVPIGTPIHASKAGTIKDLGPSDWGKYVLMKHTNGIFTLYFHLSKYKRASDAKERQDRQRAQGETVTRLARGRRIATSGACCGGAAHLHMHFLRRINGKWTSISPMLYEVEEWARTHPRKTGGDPDYCWRTWSEVRDDCHRGFSSRNSR